MTPERLGACVRDVLRRGLDDWIQAAEVVSVAISIGGASTEVDQRTLSLEIIRNVVENRLMTVGDVTGDGFHGWDLSEHDALVRIEREWLALGRRPNLGEICWLSNTEAGDDFARAVHEMSPTTGSA
jgi:hypothetical protein